MRSFWAESGLEPRYIPRHVLGTYSMAETPINSLLEVNVLTNSRLLGETVLLALYFVS